MPHTITTFRSARQRYRSDPFRYPQTIAHLGAKLLRVEVDIAATHVPSRRGAHMSARVHVGPVGGRLQLARWGRGAYTAGAEVWQYTMNPRRPSRRRRWHRETYTGHALGIRKWHEVNPVATVRCEPGRF